MGLFQVYRFFKEASDFTEPEPAALQAAGADAERHATYHQTIVRVSCVCGAIGFALGVAGLLLILTSEKPGEVQSGNGDIRMVLLPVIFAMPGLLLGAAAAC